MAQRNLVVRLRADPSAMQRGLRIGGRALRAFGGAVRSAANRVALLGAATGALAAGGLLAQANASRLAIDANAKLARNLNTSVAEVQKLRLVSKLTGTPIEDLSSGILRLTRYVGDAQKGSKQARETFSRLGLSWELLARASPVDRFRLVIAKVGEMASQTQRASVLNAIFEERWQRLGNVLENGESAFKRADQEIDKLGFGLKSLDKDLAGVLKRASEQERAVFFASKGYSATSDAVEQLNDNLGIAASRWSNFSDLVFANAAPALNAFVAELLRLNEAWLAANGGAQAVAATVGGQVVNAFLAVVRGITDAIRVARDLYSVFAPLASALSSTFQVVGDRIGKVAAFAGAIGRGEFSVAGRIATGGRDLSGAQSNDPAVREAVQREQLRVLQSMDRKLGQGVPAVAG